MSFSVNTNAGALVALQNLSVTQSQLQTTQNRINTGLKVASAKDNAAIFGIAQNQRATSNSLNSVISSLQRGQSTVDVALSAGSSVSDLLNQLKEKALAMGFGHVEAGPLVRSSYHADEQIPAARKSVLAG